MQEPDHINQVIRDEDLRRRIKKIIEEPRQSCWELWGKRLAHPAALLFIGFGLTWGVGDRLTNLFNKQELETQKRLEQIKAKQESGLAAVTRISELMYERYTTASFLASALKRNAGAEETKLRKERYDEAYVKWNIQLQTTQLMVRGLTSDSAYSTIESYIQYGLRPHYNSLDRDLTEGYDARMTGRNWNYRTTSIRTELIHCLDCCYAISNYLWMRSNLYGNEQQSQTILGQADQELARRCPRQQPKRKGSSVDEESVLEIDKEIETMSDEGLPEQP